MFSFVDGKFCENNYNSFKTYFSESKKKPSLYNGLVVAPLVCSVTILFALVDPVEQIASACLHLVGVCFAKNRKEAFEKSKQFLFNRLPEKAGLSIERIKTAFTDLFSDLHAFYGSTAEKQSKDTGNTAPVNDDKNSDAPVNDDKNSGAPVNDDKNSGAPVNDDKNSGAPGEQPKKTVPDAPVKRPIPIPVAESVLTLKDINEMIEKWRNSFDVFFVQNTWNLRGANNSSELLRNLNTLIQSIVSFKNAGGYIKNEEPEAINQFREFLQNKRQAIREHIASKPAHVIVGNLLINSINAAIQKIDELWVD